MLTRVGGCDTIKSEREVRNMKRYKITVTGQTITSCDTYEEAQKLLEEIRHGYLGLVHLQSSFKIVDTENI